jgi:hypothetical protein
MQVACRVGTLEKISDIKWMVIGLIRLLRTLRPVAQATA